MTLFSKSSGLPVLKPEEVETAGRPASHPKAKKMIELSEPSKELATRILNEVSFEERITGFNSHPGPGPQPLPIYSFEEAVCFLDAGDLSGEGWVCTIPFEALKIWIGEVLGDTELALAVGEITKEADQHMKSHQQYMKSLELIIHVKGLMEQRLKQCKAIVSEKTEA